jgi:hypothetical protein
MMVFFNFSSVRGRKYWKCVPVGHVLDDPASAVRGGGGVALADLLILIPSIIPANGAH